jgi:hypothetical protein
MQAVIMPLVLADRVSPKAVPEIKQIFGLAFAVALFSYLIKPFRVEYPYLGVSAARKDYHRGTLSAIKV